MCLLAPLTKSWRCCPRDSGLCQSLCAEPDGSELIGNHRGLASSASLPCPSMPTHIHCLNKKKIKSELIFKIQVPRAHTFWIEKQGDLIWSRPKSPGTPFHLLLLQNCSYYSSSTLVQCTESDRDQDIPCVIAQLLAGGGWRKKQLYFMFYLPLCIRFIIL